MTTFQHKEHTITFNEATGKFTAVVDGATVVKNSLDALKKFLDKPAAFAPYDALVPLDRDPGYHPVRVVGINKSRSKYGDDEFKTSDGYVHRYVYLDTPENRQVLTTIKLKRDAAREISKRYSDEIRELSDRIETIRPGDKK